MTLDRAIRLAKAWADGGVCTLQDGEVQEYHELAVAALRAQAEAEKNEPLTLKELREMDGEPVWIKPLVGWKTEPFWAIVHGRDVSDGRLSNDPERCVLSLGDTGAYWTDWLAYRRKEDVIDNA